MKNEIKVISIEHRRKLFTEDNWKTFDVTTKIDGTNEENADLIFEVRLRYLYRNYELKALLIINELKSIRAKYLKDKNDDGYGSSLEIFVMAVLLNISYKETYQKYNVIGDKDGGIDSIYWYNKIIDIYQIKSYYDDDYDEERITNNYVSYLKRNEKHPNCGALYNFVDAHKKELVRKKFNIHLISHTNKADIKIEEIFERFFQNSLFGGANDILLQLDYDERQKFQVAKIDDNIYALFMNGEQLINQLVKSENIGDINKINRFFENNVRGVLKTSKSMVHTIKNEPDNFVNYNNGITITGSIEHNANLGSFYIKNPSITNGQQTVMTLKKYITHLKNISVLVILKNVDNLDMQKNIAKYTNSQTKIKVLDLLSLDENIRELQKKLYTKNTDYFLDIYYSGDNESKRMSKLIYKKENIIKLTDFIKLYFSYKDGKIGEWKNSVSKMMENKTLSAFNIDLSIRTCACISDYYKFIKTVKNKKIRDNYKLADLAIMNISLDRSISAQESSKIIDHIIKDFNKKKFAEYKTIKDLFRSLKIKEIISSY